MQITCTIVPVGRVFVNGRGDLNVVAIEKGAFWLPLTKITNLLNSFLMLLIY